MRRARAADRTSAGLRHDLLRPARAQVLAGTATERGVAGRPARTDPGSRQQCVTVPGRLRGRRLEVPTPPRTGASAHAAELPAPRASAGVWFSSASPPPVPRVGRWNRRSGKDGRRGAGHCPCRRPSAAQADLTLAQDYTVGRRPDQPGRTGSSARPAGPGGSSGGRGGRHAVLPRTVTTVSAAISKTGNSNPDRRVRVAASVPGTTLRRPSTAQDPALAATPPTVELGQARWRLAHVGHPLPGGAPTGLARAPRCRGWAAVTTTTWFPTSVAAAMSGCVTSPS